VNLREIRGTTRDGHDRHAERTVDDIEVDDVEPPEDRSVEHHRADSLERTETPDEPDHSLGRVGPVDTNMARSDRLYVFGEGEGDRREGRDSVAAVERPVVDPHDPGVRFSEGAPQR